MHSSIKIFMLISVLFISASCIKTKDDNKANTNDKGATAVQTTAVESKFDAAVALNFINAYTDYCNRCFNKKDSTENTDNWLKKCNLITSGFLKSYFKLINDANKEDPELGLDFDPIFDAQDYPDEGFELVSSDAKTGYVIVKGKDWPAFHITLRLKYVAERWLVDGAGIINIPEGMRSKR